MDQAEVVGDVEEVVVVRVKAHQVGVEEAACQVEVVRCLKQVEVDLPEVDKQAEEGLEAAAGLPPTVLYRAVTSDRDHLVVFPPHLPTVGK